jgi:hypothetical protein
MVVAMHYLMIAALEMQLPYKLLLQGTAMGATLFLITVLGRWALGSVNSLISAGLLIVGTGLVFLPMFYSLLYPFLPRHDKAP